MVLNEDVFERYLARGDGWMFLICLVRWIAGREESIPCYCVGVNSRWYSHSEHTMKYWEDHL